MFYTYLWLRENGTPYYAGKGTAYRAFKKDSHRVNVPPKDRIIIQEFESEDDALIAEKFLIDFFGRIDLGTGILANLTDGGDHPPRYHGPKIKNILTCHPDRTHKAFGMCRKCWQLLRRRKIGIVSWQEKPKRTHCKKGHALEGDNARIWKNRIICRTCAHENYLKKA